MAITKPRENRMGITSEIGATRSRHFGVTPKLEWKLPTNLLAEGRNLAWTRPAQADAAGAGREWAGGGLHCGVCWLVGTKLVGSTQFCPPRPSNHPPKNTTMSKSERL
jgi:hypothetical protein